MSLLITQGYGGNPITQGYAGIAPPIEEARGLAMVDGRPQPEATRVGASGRLVLTRSGRIAVRVAPGYYLET